MKGRAEASCNASKIKANSVPADLQTTDAAVSLLPAPLSPEQKAAANSRSHYSRSKQKWTLVTRTRTFSTFSTCTCTYTLCTSASSTNYSFLFLLSFLFMLVTHFPSRSSLTIETMFSNHQPPFSSYSSSLSFPCHTLGNEESQHKSLPPRNGR